MSTRHSDSVKRQAPSNMMHKMKMRQDIGNGLPCLPYRRDMADVVELLQKNRRTSSSSENDSATAKLNQVFEKAIKDGDSRLIVCLLSNGLEIGPPLNEVNQTAIHFAIEQHCQARTIDLLLSHCHGSVNYVDANGLSHLHAACMAGNLGYVARLLEANRHDLNQPFGHLPGDERNGMTALHFAARYGRANIVALLLNAGADFSSRDTLGRTALHLACELPELVGDLILAETRKTHRRTDHGGTRIVDLHRRALQVLELLKSSVWDDPVTPAGCDINASDEAGDSPLLCVFRDASRNFADKRFSRDSLDFRIVNQSFKRAKRTCIGQLRQMQKAKLEFLIQHGADVRVKGSKDGGTVLHRAVEELRASRCLDEFEEPCFDDRIVRDMVELLLRAGVEVDARNDAGVTPLQQAVSVLSVEVVEVLLKHKADVRGVTFDRFHYPDILPCLEATENLLEIVESLKSRGLSLCQSDELAILRFLVANNADCQYAVPGDEDSAYKLANLLELGTDGNIRSSLARIAQQRPGRSWMLSDASCKHLIKLGYGNLRINREVERCIKSSVWDDPSVSLQLVEEYKREAQNMKTTKLNNNMSLSEILSVKPADFYVCFKSSNYRNVLRSGGFYRTYKHCGGLIKGYFAKSLIRRFILKSTSDYLRCAVAVGLPDLCCERIASFLSNEDLWNLCLSSTIDISEDDEDLENLTNRVANL